VPVPHAHRLALFRQRVLDVLLQITVVLLQVAADLLNRSTIFEIGITDRVASDFLDLSLRLFKRVL